MNQIILLIQIIISIVLATIILLQVKGEGLRSGMGSNFQTTRRGFEKILFNATIICTILFVAASLASIVLA